MPRSRPPYPREFLEEAVRLVRSSGRPIAQIARELGIAHGTLSAWVKQAELDAGLRNDGLTTAEREELRRLRRENRILREEREIRTVPMKSVWTYPAFVDRVTLTDSGFADHLLSNSSGDRYPRAECRLLRL